MNDLLSEYDLLNLSPVDPLMSTLRRAMKTFVIARRQQSVHAKREQGNWRQVVLITVLSILNTTTWLSIHPRKCSKRRQRTSNNAI